MSLIECEIFWNDKPNEVMTVVCDTESWNEIEDKRDQEIFWYFEGEDPLEGGDEFAVVSYEPIEGDYDG